ncbi:MAG TPA: hypothetical protein VGP72_13480 [Planctomycetota bacterium]
MKPFLSALTLFLSLAAVAAQPTDTLVIATRQTAPWLETLRTGAPAKDFQTAIEAAAARLGAIASEDSSKEESAIAEALRSDRQRSGKALGALLDWNRHEPALRRGALKALALTQPDPSVTAKALANSALAEPVPEIRSAAINLIRDRKDAAVAAELVKYWRNAYDETTGFDESKRTAAVAAMRDIGDRRCVQALLAYVSLEVYAASAGSPVMSNVNITGNGINLPIELPGLDIQSVQGTIVVPAATSLKALSGQDFGRNINKWRDWLGKQPEFSKQ